MSANQLSNFEPFSDLDFHQLLVPTPTEETPRPRKKDGSISSIPSSDADSFFVPEPLSRSNSIYSFSRASLSSQLAGLSSMTLPQAESLAANITTLSTARKACKALNAAAEQIGSWNRKALRVLKDLDADNDVEWAAAAGRDALEETGKTISKFENLINVYVLSIEELQSRHDVGDLRPEELTVVVEQMETTLIGWDDVRKHLQRVHEQVEIAMEWEELWNTVLGEVGVELDSLSQLVFEMEEKRHLAYMSKSKDEPEQKIDLNELESFIDEPAKKKDNLNSRFSMTFESSPLGSPVIENPQDDSNLLALFARMQPLRASLDFLPMRVSLFETRAEGVFPQACKELQDKRERLEKNWAQLSDEAERLRRELSEDRWIIVFRNAGRQAQKMAESVERSVGKVQDAIDAGYQRSNPAALAKRVESFEAKKMHYMPAIQRVLSIIQKGLKDRLTVNGEILRLNKDISARMRDLEDKIEQLAGLLEPITTRTNSRLRESISSIVSADRSHSSGTIAGTPGSSPASSIDLPSSAGQKHVSKYGLNGYTKPRAPSSTRPPPLSSNNRRASVQPPRRPMTPLSARSAGSTSRRAQSPAPPSIYQQGLYRPPTAQLPNRPAVTPSDKPRWSSIVRPNEFDAVKASRRTSKITPSSYYRIAPRSFSTSTSLPLRSPLGQHSASSPLTPQSPMTDTSPSTPHLRSFAERIKDPTAQETGLMAPVPYSKSRNSSAPMSNFVRSPSALGSYNSNNNPTARPPGPPLARPPSSLRSFRPSSRIATNTTSNLNSSQSAYSHSTHNILAHERNGGSITNNNHSRTPPRKSEDSAVADLDQSSLDQTNSDAGSVGEYDPYSSHNYASSSYSQSRYHRIEADLHSEADIEEQNEYDDRSTEVGSSPLSRRTVTRPPSVVPGTGRGKRQSMLPLPVGVATNGRVSAAGFR